MNSIVIVEQELSKDVVLGETGNVPQPTGALLTARHACTCRIALFGTLFCKYGSQAVLNMVTQRSAAALSVGVARLLRADATRAEHASVSCWQVSRSSPTLNLFVVLLPVVHHLTGGTAASTMVSSIRSLLAGRMCICIAAIEFNHEHTSCGGVGLIITSFLPHGSCSRKLSRTTVRCCDPERHILDRNCNPAQ